MGYCYKCGCYKLLVAWLMCQACIDKWNKQWREDHDPDRLSGR